MSNRLEALSYTGRRMIACSLEIDGRTSRAAEAVMSGHVSEYTYDGATGRPLSPKAIALSELEAEIKAEIARVGVDALVEALRTPRRPVTPITEDAKTFGGRDAYSVRIVCPVCEGTKRHDGQTCGRCAGYGHMWEKPALRTEADQAAVEAQAVEAARHRAEGEEIRRAARAAREALPAVAEALPAARDLARDLATAEAEIDDDEPTEDRARVWDEAAAAYRRAFKLTVGWPLENPYEQPACGVETYRETRETPAEYCETPANECTEH